MRNYVSKVLIGEGTANTSIAGILPEALTIGQIIAFDPDTGVDLVAGSANVSFALGTAVLGEPIIAGPFAKASISSLYSNAYQAAVKKKVTLTVDTVPTAGKSPFFKVVYHDNLSILPNQMKQTAVSVEAVTGDTTTTYAAKIAAAFNLQDFKFVAVTSATNVVTFESEVVATESAYNSIDRPEVVNFEVGAQEEDTYGAYTIADTVALKLGQGSPAKIAWMAEQAQGRRGFNDRRLWNNAKHQFDSGVDPAETYDVVVLTANDVREGDMQDTRSNPVGAILALEVGTLAVVAIDLAVAGIVPVVVPPSS
jgi:hypothetical protein